MLEGDWCGRFGGSGFDRFLDHRTRRWTRCNGRFRGGCYGRFFQLLDKTLHSRDALGKLFPALLIFLTLASALAVAAPDEHPGTKKHSYDEKAGEDKDVVQVS